MSSDIDIPIKRAPTNFIPLGIAMSPLPIAVLVASLCALAVTAPVQAQVLVRPTGVRPMSVEYESGEKALKQFRALVAARDSAGECQPLTGAPPSFPSYFVHYPSAAAPLTTISLWVSGGALTRSQEDRSSEPMSSLSGSLSPEERAKIFQERDARRDQTFLVLYFDSGEATVYNRHAGELAGAVRGSIAEITALASVGPSSERAKRALALCQSRSGIN